MLITGLQRVPLVLALPFPVAFPFWFHIDLIIHCALKSTNQINW